MPIIKSAKKRVRVSTKQRIKNLRIKRQLHDRVKNLQAAISGKKDSTNSQAEVYSSLDTAVKKGIISKNKAARKKRQYNEATRLAGTTKTGAKAAKKVATTPKAKTPAKKSTTKPATAKSPAKKPAKKPSTAKSAKK